MLLAIDARDIPLTQKQPGASIRQLSIANETMLGGGTRFALTVM
jgi:hypothetical protein